MKELEDKLDHLYTNLQSREKYYHLKSVKNFISNIDHIQNEKDKILAYNILLTYLDIVNENGIFSNKESRKVFIDYIEPLGLIFKKHMKYYFLILPSSLVLVAIILNLVFFLFTKSALVFLVFNSIFLILYLILMLFLRKGNVYCYNY
jgi:hypothetical protein